MLYCFTHKNHTGTLRSEMDAWQACVLMNDFLPMASVRSNERFLADGKRRLRRFADTCLQSYKLFEKVLPF